MNAHVGNKVRATLSAVVIRADGRREDLGVIATTEQRKLHTAPLVTTRIAHIGPKKEG